MADLIVSPIAAFGAFASCLMEAMAAHLTLIWAFSHRAHRAHAASAEVLGL